MYFALRTVIVLVVLAITAVGGWWAFHKLQQPPPNEASPEPMVEEVIPPSPATVIVGDQAQKNLGIIAKPLIAETFWKTITVQGMVVDRPGMSDREVVSPAVGTVIQLLHVPGDMVRPGEVLFRIKLASESLQETQTQLFKTSQDILLAEARRARLQTGGEAIAQVRVIEAENELTRLKVADRAIRLELANRGFTDEEINGIAEGKLLNEISIRAPTASKALEALPAKEDPVPRSDEQQPFTYEFQELKVALGEQLQAGQTLCRLSNHQWLAIEGRAFRDETPLLEQSVKEAWPVEVDFQEFQKDDWPTLEQCFLIRYLANTIDPVTRTFAFLIPLQNQYKTVDHGGHKQLLWRYRPGQKVRLRIRVENLDNVFVLPSDAVAIEGAEAYLFTQNVNTFERHSIHILFRDRDRVVIANDGTFRAYKRGSQFWTVAAVVRVAAAQLNRMAKSGATSSDVPKGFHIHADGSLHKNEDEVRE
jgi:membrane fusion protein, heavy metal efflux system